MMQFVVAVCKLHPQEECVSSHNLLGIMCIWNVEGRQIKLCADCREMPGELERVMVWFRDYKIPDGKPANEYGYDAKPMNSEFAKLVIGETHELYKDLKEGKRNNHGELALS